MSAHPPLAELQQFALGDTCQLSKDSSSRVVRHLMTGCPRCRRLMEEVQILLGPRRPAQSPSDFDYTEIFSQAEEGVELLLTEGEAALEAKVATLLTRVPELEGIQKLGRSVSLPFLIKWFVHRSHQLRFRDPERMLRYASFARASADACSAAQAGSRARLSGLRTRAWSELGNALRIRGDSRSAEECFGTAYGFYFSSNGDLEVQAELLQKIGSFKIYQEEFDEAIGIVREAGEIYEELGQRSKFASVLIQEAVALVHRGDMQAAILKLGTALPLIDPEEDGYLLIASRQNMVRCYAELGMVKQAFGMLTEVKHMQAIQDPLVRLRASWNEAILYYEIGELDTSARLLRQVRQGFASRGLIYEVAVIGLRLGDIYLRQGRLDKLRRMLAESAPMFKALRARRESLALLILGEAVDLDFAPLMA